MNLRALIVAVLVSPLAAWAQAPKEDDVYPITTFKIPETLVLEAGALEMLPGDTLAVGTRRGDVYLVDQPLTTNGQDVKYTNFASGLHEVLGLAWKDGWLYAVHRCEVSRMRDEDGDGRADVFETVCDDFGITGDYHEYAFGSKFDKGRQPVDRALPDRLVLVGGEVSRLVPADHARRQSDPDVQRPAVAGRHRGERRRGHVLHGQPGPLERGL